VDVSGREDFEALLELLSVVRDSGLRYPMSAIVDRTDHEGNMVSLKVRVSDGDHSWSVKGNGGSITSDPSQGCVIRTGGRVETIGHERPDWLPDEIQLFYPLTMRIWGGHQDNQRITGAARTQDGIRLSMVYLEDAEYVAEATFDSQHGVVTDFRTATDHLSVRDLRTDIRVGD
jgi:hypothetical protein